MYTNWVFCDATIKRSSCVGRQPYVPAFVGLAADANWRIRANQISKMVHLGGHPCSAAGLPTLHCNLQNGAPLVQGTVRALFMRAYCHSASASQCLVSSKRRKESGKHVKGRHVPHFLGGGGVSSFFFMKLPNRLFPFLSSGLLLSAPALGAEGCSPGPAMVCSCSASVRPIKPCKQSSSMRPSLSHAGEQPGRQVLVAITIIIIISLQGSQHHVPKM